MNTSKTLITESQAQAPTTPERYISHLVSESFRTQARREETAQMKVIRVITAQLVLKSITQTIQLILILALNSVQAPEMI